MVIGVLELDMRLFSPNSLKDKRSLIKGLISRIRNNFNVSVSEIGYQDLWQRTLVGVALITGEKSFAQRVLSKIMRFVEKERDVSLIDSKMEVL
jgi:hypothetical protein